MDVLWQDLKYAFRSIGRQPGLLGAVLLALMLGISTNTVIFTVVNAVLLNPLSLSAWKDPGQVLMLWQKNPSLSLMFANQIPVRPDNYRAWKQQARSFEDLAAWRDATVTLTDRDNIRRNPEQVEAGFATADLFLLMGVRPQLGRNFTAREMEAGGGQVTLLSDELYRSRFHSDARVIGSSLTVEGKPYTIIGVLPGRVAFPGIFGEQKGPKLWMPLDLHPEKQTDEAFTLYVFGRLRKGVTVSQAKAEMHTIESRLARTPLEEGGFGIHAVTLREAAIDPDLRRAVLVLQIAVGFVLLIACANAGNLLLTRAVARDKEMAVRSAIGASSFRLLRQTLTESVLLSFAAAMLGLLLAIVGLRVLYAIAPKDTFGPQDLRIDGYVLAFTAAISVITGILFGLVPAYHSWKTNLNEALNRSARSVAGSSNRLRSALVVAEIALSLVLVVGAGLMIRSLSVVMNTDLGFRIDHLLVMRLALPEFAYGSAEKVAAFDNRLIESVRALSGVKAAALTTALPMKSVSQSSFEISGRATAKDKLPVTDWARVTDGYFETLGMRVLAGRSFTRGEAVSADPSVAVVNQAFAKTFFPGEDPLGKVVTFANEKGTNAPFRVVGVVANEHQMGPDNAQGLELYLPGQHQANFLLVARTEGDPLRLANAIKQQVWSIDKDQPVSEVMTEEDALREWSAPRRFNLTILLTFAAIAVLLSALGLYSVLAYVVTLRTREIGIRMAMGAEPKTVARQFVRGGLMLAFAGITIGLGAALALTRFLSSLIYGVSAFDPATFAVVVGVLILIAAMASYVPALRAARIDPMEALRME